MVWTNLPEIEKYLPTTVDPNGVASRCWNQIKICIKKDALNTTDLKYHSLFILLAKIRSFGVDTVHNMHCFQEGSCELEDVLIRLEDIFFPLIFILYERFKFSLRARGSEETAEDYLCALDNMTESCEFSAVKEIRIKEQLLFQNAVHQSLKETTESCSLSKLKEQLASFSEHQFNHYENEKLLNHPKFKRHSPRIYVEQSFKNNAIETKKKCDQPFCRSSRTALRSVKHRKRMGVKSNLKGRNLSVKTASLSFIVDRYKNGKGNGHTSLLEDNSTENKIFVSNNVSSPKSLASTETGDSRTGECLRTGDVGDCCDQKKSRLIPAPTVEVMDVAADVKEKERTEFTEKSKCPTDVTIQTNTLFLCQTRSETFPTKEKNLEVHRAVCSEFSHKFDCPSRLLSEHTEGKYHSNPFVNKPKRRRIHDDYTCLECSVKIHGKRSFNKHMNGHNLYCDICNKVLDCRYTYKLHMDGHRGNKPYKCAECSQSFTRKSDLKTHSDIHNPERKKNHVCGFCGKDFYRIHELNRHSRLHIEDKSHVCDVCKKGFPTAYGLKCHHILHTGVKSFTCDKCGKSFAQKSNLVMHLLRHTGIKEHECYTCGLKFARKCYLESHRQTHSKEKPYTCEICGTCVSSRYSLQRHKLVHSGLKPHICQLCGQSFTWQSTYKNHMESHGNQNLV